ncbi:DUF2789 domain-containing protein [Variovorax sp. J2P1-59]|uniref:DUF2789 domain-containing protein n=1 Tax=Variovorax flavidus TaxID=3053501 RepID=UPI0025782CB7|nr:DUF2789 domain-containing protein [Variovorax sp. J2P1-59]MDM0073644.1 DUF2789 domain-containing protein [Variovorax sp. J2P1-59]
MDSGNHTIADLFAQLGLGNTSAEIDQFVAQHRPLSNSLQLADAPFWNDGQAQFLREEISEDADWAEVVDQLNALLRA